MIRLPSGIYITGEGPEGCGKTTQLKMLYERLSAEGYDVVMTKEPGGLACKEGEIGKGPCTAGIRWALLNPKIKLTPKQESELFWVDRIIHHVAYIIPLLEEGKIVLGDRDFDSSWAYQHYARGIDFAWMLEREQEAIGNFKPHGTLLYEGDVDHFLRRVNRRKTEDAVAAAESKFDDEQLGFHKKVMYGFLDRAKKEPQRFRVLDGMKGIEDLFEDTYREAKQFIDKYAA